MSESLKGNLPPAFEENVLGVCGERGRQWLGDLPKIVDRIAKKWSLAVDAPFPNLSYNYVAPCVCVDGSLAVLKIGLPEAADSIICGEARFLGILNGSGAVKLLRYDENHRALLLKRLLPGENLKRLCAADDERTTRIAVEVLHRIKCEPPKGHKFRTLESWIESFQKAVPKSFYADQMKKAQRFFAELLAASKKQQLLHGDFHHQNILSAQREPFLAIDPKGIVGDIGFETSVFLNNPRGWLLQHPNRQAIAARRIEIFAEAFAIEPSDLRKWAYAEAVLSAWWTIEDGGTDAEKWLACAAIWET